MLASALFFEFASCGGTELMSGLCSAAIDLSTRWTEDLAPSLPEEKGKVNTNLIEQSRNWYFVKEMKGFGYCICLFSVGFIQIYFHAKRRANSK